MTMERTLSIIKPDAVAKNAIGQIYARFEAAGLRIVAARMMHLSRARAEAFYAVHRDRPFFPELVEFMVSGPCMVQVLEGDDAIAKNREVMGATNPAEAAPGTIRAGLRGRSHRERGAWFRWPRQREKRDRVLLRRRRRLPANPLTAARRSGRSFEECPNPPVPRPRTCWGCHGKGCGTSSRRSARSRSERPRC